VRRREARCAGREPRSRRRPGGKHLSADPGGTISNQEVAGVKAAGHACLDRINAEAPAAARLPPARTHQPQEQFRFAGPRFGRPPEHKAKEPTMTTLVNALARSGLLREDLDYHLLRASMVIIFLLFGYQKWFAYEAQVLVPYISNGPLIWWMYPVFGIRGASWFLGISEWLFGALLFLGFWNKQLGILGALGSVGTFVMTVTIIPFMPNGWDPAAGFPAMAGNIPFLMKDVVLLAVSIYLLKQDVMRATISARQHR
jgi:uncharacterized membrane protein YkgB